MRLLPIALFIGVSIVSSRALIYRSAAIKRHAGSSIARMSTATTAELGVCQEASSFFFPHQSPETIKFTPTSGGVNNVVQYLETNDNKRYILRIYNNGFNTKRVAYEHAILDQLAESQTLSFQIPTTIKSFKTGKAFVRLSNNAEACVCNVIPGGLPKLTCVENIGRASGELNTAMASLKIDPKLCPTPPYYELFKVHHAVTPEKFYETMSSSIFDGVRKHANLLTNEIRDMEAKIAATYANLPSQIIHGDLHYDNVLVLDGKVTGLLDFEFCAVDWRAMEIAICLSKYAGEREALRYFDEFTTGFATHGKLTDAEIAAVPDLINLRILSNVVYFVGRALSNEDTIDILVSKAETYWNRVQWIKDNSNEIVSLITKKFKNK